MVLAGGTFLDGEGPGAPSRPSGRARSISAIAVLGMAAVAAVCVIYLDAGGHLGRVGTERGGAADELLSKPHDLHFSNVSQPAPSSLSPRTRHLDDLLLWGAGGPELKTQHVDVMWLKKALGGAQCVLTTSCHVLPADAAGTCPCSQGRGCFTSPRAAH